MSEKVSVIIQCLAQVAWADGRLLPAEAHLFQRMIEGVELPPETARRAWRAAVTPGEWPSASDLSCLSQQDRDLVLTMSRDMANRDGGMCDEESEAMERLERLFDESPV